MKRVVLLLGCLLGITAGVHAGELYRWVDSDGKVHYGDTPPADTKKIETKKLSDAPTANENLPYETRRAQQNFPVTLYVADSCGEPCDKARTFLRKRGIPFSEKSLTTKEEIDAFKKLSGSSSSPTLSIGKNFLIGFLAEQWQRELDFAGYPKTSAYRGPGTPSAPAAASKVAPAKSATQ